MSFRARWSRRVECAGVALALISWSAAPLAAQSSWSPTFSLGLSRLLADADGAVSDGPALGSVAGRLQLLRVSEGRIAWGIEAGYYRWGRFPATTVCSDPSCTAPVTTEYSVLSAFEAGVAARLGERGGRRGPYAAAALSVAIAVDSHEGDSATGPGASLGGGYVLGQEGAPRVFIELMMHGMVVAAAGGVGSGLHLAGLLGIAF